MKRTGTSPHLILFLLVSSIFYGQIVTLGHSAPQTRGFSPANLPDLSGTVMVYLLHLSDVPTPVANFSRFLAGIRDFAQNRILVTHTIFGDRMTNVTIRVIQITDWSSYRDLILNGDNFILINSHGSYLPIPTGLTSDQWFGDILLAMSNRYVTWTHIAGFPYYQGWNEGIGPSVLGPSLFLKLASFSVWPATVTPDPSKIPATTTDYFQAVRGTLWQPGLGNFGGYGTSVETTGPTDFSFAIPESSIGQGFHGFYAVRNGTTIYYSGVVARVNGTSPNSYGLYAHFVPGTFGFLDGYPSGVDIDYGRGLMGLMMPLEWQVFETANNIHVADATIRSEQSSGYTDGLDQAKSHLSSAEFEFASGHDLSAWIDASTALARANSAKIPWIVQEWPYVTLAGGILAFSLILSLGATVPALIATTAGNIAGSQGHQGILKRLLRFLRKRKGNDGSVARP